MTFIINIRVKQYILWMSCCDILFSDVMPISQKYVQKDTIISYNTDVFDEINNSITTVSSFKQISETSDRSIQSNSI